jgi:hypothetical protein
MDGDEKVFESIEELASAIRKSEKGAYDVFFISVKARYERCELCGDYTTAWVMHHVSYDPEIVVVLCASCHKRLHLGLLKSSGRVVRVWLRSKYPWRVKMFKVSDRVLIHSGNKCYKSTVVELSEASEARAQDRCYEAVVGGE